MSVHSAAEREGLVRKIPWKLLVTVALLLVIGSLGYFAVEGRREESLRRALLARQEELQQQGGAALADLRERIGALITAEAGVYAGDRFDPGFDPGSYKGQVGLYLRLPRAIAAQRQTLEPAAQRQNKDALPGCLGLEAVRYGQVLREGFILTDDFRKSIIEASNFTRLQVLAEDFRVRVERDLQLLASHLRPSYLLLVLEEEATAELQWYRLIFFDLEREQPAVPLARARTGSANRLLPVRWLPLPDRRPREAEQDRQAENTAADCAIAVAIKPPGAVAGAADGPGEAPAASEAADPGTAASQPPGTSPPAPPLPVPGGTPPAAEPAGGGR